MKLSERQHLELIQQIAESEYLETGDKWWLGLVERIEKRLKPKEIDRWWLRK